MKVKVLYNDFDENNQVDKSIFAIIDYKSRLDYTMEYTREIKNGMFTAGENALGDKVEVAAIFVEYINGEEVTPLERFIKDHHHDGIVVFGIKGENSTFLACGRTGGYDTSNILMEYDELVDGVVRAISHIELELDNGRQPNLNSIVKDLNKNIIQ